MSSMYEVAEEGRAQYEAYHATRTTDYLIVARFLVDGVGWKRESETVSGTLEEAWREASSKAEALDERYAGEHFWTVDLQSPDGGSYVQLFHGRLE
jgi:hypothetical protein